jgi:hypothetical protein
MAEISISIKNGNSKTDLGEFVGKDDYAPIKFGAIADIKSEHINNHDGNEYLEILNIKLSEFTYDKLNLFKVNSCENGKVLEIHVATGSQLKKVAYNYTYKIEKEHLLYSQNPETIQIRFVVYNYGKNLTHDLYIYECKTKKGKIPVYDELDQAIVANKLKENIDPIPRVRKGNILKGLRP